MPVTYRIVADTAEELAEPLRKIAKQENGKLVVEGLPEGFAVEDVKGLKNTVQTLRGENGTLRETVKAFEAAGLTHEQAKEAAEALGKMKAGTLKSSTELDAWKKELETKFSTDRTSLEKQLAEMRLREDAYVVDGPLAKIIAAKGGADALDVISTYARRNIRVVREDGKPPSVVVVGNDGKTALVTKKVGSTDPMGLEELIDVMRESPATKPLFRVQAAGGSGSASQSAGSGQAGQQTEDPSRLSPAELIARGNRAKSA